MGSRWNRRWIAAGAIVLAAGGVWKSSAAPVTPPPGDLAALPRDGSAFISLRLADVGGSGAAKSLWERKGRELMEMFLLNPAAGRIASPAQIERIVFFWDEGERFSGGMVVRDPAPLSKAVALEFSAAGERRPNGRRYYRRERDWRGVLMMDRRSALFGTPDWLEVRAAQPDGSRAGPLAAAIEAAARHDFVLAARFDKPSAITDPVLEGLGEQEATRPLEKARGALLVVDTQKELIVECHFDFADAEAAERAMPALRALRARVRGRMSMLAAELAGYKESKEDNTLRTTFADFCIKTAEAMKTASVRRNGAVGTLSFRCACEDAATGALVFNMACLRWTSSAVPVPVRAWPEQAHLEKLAKAFRAYHDANGRLPPAALWDKDGKALLSWRVLLLPYLGEEKLYKQFRLDEAWDSRHNIQLVPKMPVVFGTSNDADQTPTSCFRVFTGKGTLFDGPQGVSLKDVSKPAQRLLVVQAATPVPWSKPEELILPAKGPLPELGYAGWCQVAYADGTVEGVCTGRIAPYIEQNGKMIQASVTDGVEGAERRELLRQAICRDGKHPNRKRLASEPPDYERERSTGYRRQPRIIP